MSVIDQNEKPGLTWTGRASRVVAKTKTTLAFHLTFVNVHGVEWIGTSQEERGKEESLPGAVAGCLTAKLNITSVFRLTTRTPSFVIVGFEWALGN